MKVLIVSDSHGRNGNLSRVIDRVKPIDLLIHLGDVVGTEDEIELLAECPVEMVAGNNDYFSHLPREKVITVGGQRIFMTHGHRYGVYQGTEQLIEAAKSYGADIAMFGHTHIPHIDLQSEVITINPGSISLPRQPDRVPTFIIMEIDEKKKVHFNLNFFR